MRYDQHLSGLGGKYTAAHGVKAMVFFEEHTDLDEARRRERQIKDWSQNKKRTILIEKFKM